MRNNGIASIIAFACLLVAAPTHAQQGAPEDATLALPASSDATNYSVAIPIFRYIATKYTNSPIAAQAWGRLGDCYFALAANAPADYETATNAFNMAIESSFADATARSMAELRMGQALEAMARLKPTGEQKPLFAAALLHFLNVLHGSNLHEGEQPDLYWVKEAGVAAAALSEELGEWRQAKQFYQELQTLAPPMRGWLEKKIARVEEHLSTEKH